MKLFVPFSLLIAFTSFGGTAHSAGLENAQFEPKIGALKVFAYKNPKDHLSCSAAHLGDGIMITAGHCFLGSHDCNRAVVELPDARGKIQKHFCQEIVSIESAIASPLKPYADFALFRVLPLTTNNVPENSSITLADQGCSNLLPVDQDYFGRQRIQLTYFTICPGAGRPHGQPIKDTHTGKILGLVQGHFRPADSAKNLKTYVGALPESFPALPAETISGQFASEAYPYGLGGDLNFTVKNYGGSGTVKLKIVRSSSTEIRVLEGSGFETVYRGVPSHSESLIQTFQRPVTVRASTGPNVKSVFVSLYEIED